jgi:hypothetical protein
MYVAMYPNEEASVGHMIRKRIYIEPEQEELLKQRARELGVTESDLIRRGIDQIARVGVPVVRDQRAWEDELEFMRQRSQLPHLGHARSWTREELYEARVSNRSGPNKVLRALRTAIDAET